MTFNECKTCIKADLARMTNVDFMGVKYLIFNASFKITFWFRVGSYLKGKSNFFFLCLFGIVFLIHKHNQYKTGIQLPFKTNIGPGLVFPHFSCIIINPKTKIGENCTVFQGVTIGSKRGADGGSPQFGDNCVIGAGASIIGNCKIGNNVFIGANALVVKDIPDNSVVGGNPAKILNYEGKANTKLYNNIY